MPFYRINAGPAALDNGATTPLSTMFSLAEVLDRKVLSGEYYGNDYIEVPDSPEEQRIAEELLNDAKLPWERVDDLPYQLRGSA